MKHILYIIIFLFAGNLLAQEQKLYDVSEVREMPIFPNCEEIRPRNKKKVSECISKSLTTLLSSKLKGFENVMYENNLSEAYAMIQFVISKEGIIHGIQEMEGSNPLLAEAAVVSLDQISQELPPIRPAKLRSGESVNLRLQFPLRFKVDLNSANFDKIEYPVDEIVLFSLFEKDYRYEIRLFNNKNIKVYELKDDRETYLGRFMSMNELLRSEPYRSLVEEVKSSDRFFVTDGELDNENYEVYIINLFNKTKPVYVEVLKEIDGEKVIVEEFKKELDFSNSIYAPLIYR